MKYTALSSSPSKKALRKTTHIYLTMKSLEKANLCTSEIYEKLEKYLLASLKNVGRLAYRLLRQAWRTVAYPHLDEYWLIPSKERHRECKLVSIKERLRKTAHVYLTIKCLKKANLCTSELYEKLEKYNLASLKNVRRLAYRLLREAWRTVAYSHLTKKLMENTGISPSKKGLKNVNLCPLSLRREETGLCLCN